MSEVIGTCDNRDGTWDAILGHPNDKVALGVTPTKIIWVKVYPALGTKEGTLGSPLPMLPKRVLSVREAMTAATVRRSVRELQGPRR